MAIGLDDALLGWLVASVGDAVARRLRGDPARRAMREVVERAVEATVAEVGGHLDGHAADHLRSSLLIHYYPSNVESLPVTTRAGLRRALHYWTEALDQPACGEPGYLSGLGVDASVLADTLTAQIFGGINRNARSGGALDRLAAWLWRDGLNDHLTRIETKLDAAVIPAPPAGGGLPGGTPDFTGRQEALEELAERVQAHDPAGIVVAIHAVVGMAGVGKTELALRVAHQHKHRYPDGHYFIDLHGYTQGVAPVSPVVALEELLRRTGLQGKDIPADLAGRQARWQALMAGRRALVLLDNALNADQVRLLLPRAAGCLVLITSRCVLRGLPGARTLQLGVLPQEEAIELFTRVADSDDPLDRQAVTTALEHVGSLPLAVRAIASQVGDSYSETELAGDLTRAKERAILVAEAGPLGPEARTAFDISLQRLDPPHQRAFGILGIYPGPVIGVPQFAALAGVPVTEANSLLRALTRWNLIAPYTGVGHRCYQQHDLLRDYARQHTGAHIPVEERSAALARLTVWYASTIMLIEPLLDADDTVKATRPVTEGLELDGADRAEEWIAGEEDNLLALAEHASGPSGAAVCSRYGRWLQVLYRRASAALLHASAVRLYREMDDLTGEADALLGMGQSALATGDILVADDHLKAALKLHRRTGNQRGEADTLVGLGRVGIETGSYASAHADLSAALRLYRRAGDQRGEDEVLHWMGCLAVIAGDMGFVGELFGRYDKAAMPQVLGEATLGE